MDIFELAKARILTGGKGSGGGGASSWNDLKDKPFGEETVNFGDTLTWDGQPTDTSYVIDESIGDMILRVVVAMVSDATPTIEQIQDATLELVNQGQRSEHKISGNTFVTINDYGSYYQVRLEIISFYVVREAGAIIENEYTAPERGIYFTSLAGVTYISSLTIPGYGLFKPTITHKIDKKFLPDSAGGEFVISADVDGNPAFTAAEFIDAVKNKTPLVMRLVFPVGVIEIKVESRTYSTSMYGNQVAVTFVSVNPLASTRENAGSLALWTVTCTDNETIEFSSKDLVLPAISADEDSQGSGIPQYLYQRKVEAAVDYGLTDRIIMYSPNGTQYYLTVSDDGTLSASKQ